MVELAPEWDPPSVPRAWPATAVSLQDSSAARARPDVEQGTMG
jgi:hypothetical protein